jgi:primosomal protein N'
MGKIKKSANEVMTRSRDAAVRVGKVAKSAVVVGAKAGALEAQRSWKETSPATAKKRTRKGVAAVLAGAVVLGAVGAAIASSRKKL